MLISFWRQNLLELDTRSTQIPNQFATDTIKSLAPSQLNKHAFLLLISKLLAADTIDILNVILNRGLHYVWSFFCTVFCFCV